MDPLRTLVQNESIGPDKGQKRETCEKKSNWQGLRRFEQVILGRKRTRRGGLSVA